MCVTKFAVCLSFLQYNDELSHQSYALSYVHLSNLRRGLMDKDTVTVPKFQKNQLSTATHWADGSKMIMDINPYASAMGQDDMGPSQSTIQQSMVLVSLMVGLPTSQFSYQHTYITMLLTCTFYNCLHVVNNLLGSDLVIQQAHMPQHMGTYYPPPNGEGGVPSSYQKGAIHVTDRGERGECNHHSTRKCDVTKDVFPFNV